MARIETAPEVLDDFGRFFDHIAQVGAAPARLDEILATIQVLSTSPLIGRPAKNGLRELVIGQGARGYVALYRYVPPIDTVFVLGIRGQREAGYQGRDDG